MMEFVEGVKEKETLGVAQILEGSYEDWCSAYTKKASQILISMI